MLEAVNSLPSVVRILTLCKKAGITDVHLCVALRGRIRTRNSALTAPEGTVITSVNDKIVLITGANRGIGKAFVEGAIQQGAQKVYAAVRDLKSADALVASLGQRVKPVPVNLADAASIARLAELAPDVDVVINNAGVLKLADPLEPAAFESLDFEFAVNVYGFLRIAQAFAPALIERSGLLVQVNSVVSMKAYANFSTYSASKAASYSLTQSLRESLAQKGVRVISVHPGPIATDMGRDAGLEEIAEPPAVVADALWQAMNEGVFHVFPDSMARQLGAAYESFAENVVEASAT